MNGLLEVAVMEAPPMSKYMTLSKAAERLEVNRSTVWRWVKDGHFGKTRRKGLGEKSAILVSEESVEEVAEKLGIGELTEE